ncbi:MAG: sulfotransferase domain-containing protein [Pseudomonadota bacterium]
MPALSPREVASADYSGEVSDPSRWASFAARPGDIVVNTPSKSGTTWVQGILAMLIAEDPGVEADISLKSPWIDIKFRDWEETCARLEAQTHRRQVKSHTPYDGLPWWDELRYISVYRHPIDVHFSFRAHVDNMAYDMLKRFFPEDPRESFAAFLEGGEPDAMPLSTIVAHYKCALARRGRENLLILHYRDMLRDLRGAVAQIAAHTGLAGAPSLLDEVTEAATFENMRENCARFTPSAGQGVWLSDAGFFANAGCNKWEGVLADADLAAYDARISELLTLEDRAWLEWGSVP